VFRPSEKGLLRRHAVATGEALRTRLSLPENLIGELPSGRIRGLQPELPQALERPADIAPCPPFVGRRLGDHEPSPDLQEGGATLGHDGRAPEGAGEYAVKCSPPSSIPAELLSPAAHGLDPPLKAQTLDGAAQEVGAPGTGVEQDEGGLGPVLSHHQTGQPSARTQVDHPGPGAGPQGPGDLGEPLGVAQLDLEWAGTQESRPPSVRQNLVQHGDCRWRRGVGGRGERGWRRGRGRSGGGGDGEVGVAPAPLVGSGHRRPGRQPAGAMTM
jgi:hypothetical protein